MFLVVGQRGSEARLVANALDAHPDLTVAGGGELLLPLAFLLQRVSDPPVARTLAGDLIVADRGFAAGIGRHLDADAVRAVLADAPLAPGPTPVRGVRGGGGGGRDPAGGHAADGARQPRAEPHRPLRR